MQVPSTETKGQQSTVSGSRTQEKPAPAMTGGWGDLFLKQNKAANDSTNKATQAFINNPSIASQGVLGGKSESSYPPFAAPKQDKPAKPATGGWGDLFLKQNKAATDATNAATKAFIGNPSQAPPAFGAPAQKKSEAATSSWETLFSQPKKAAGESTDKAAQLANGSQASSAKPALAFPDQSTVTKDEAPAAGGWAPPFLQPKEHASDVTQSAAEAFPSKPAGNTTESQAPRNGDAALTPSKAVGGDAWGDAFLKQNQAAKEATNKATSDFLGNPSQAAFGRPIEQPDSAATPGELPRSKLESF